MSIRTLRESKLFSQERLSEISGLSLRTIQRVEAGHRISYASLRALAATFEIDVDSLERELYSMNKSTDESFIEIPRWVRILHGEGWSMGPTPSRRDAHILEAILMAFAITFFAVSFFVTSELAVALFRYCALFELVCCYLMSVGSRIVDAYKLWSNTDAIFSRGSLGLGKTKT